MPPCSTIQSSFFFQMSIVFFEHREQPEVLGQRVGQLDVSISIRTRHPEREYGSDSVRLRLKRIRVEGGGVVLHL